MPTSPIDLSLLLEALATPTAVFVLGAGASSPAIPTMAQLPDPVAPYARQLSSFPQDKYPILLFEGLSSR